MKPKYLIILIFLMLSGTLFSQVGVGTETPFEKAILEVKSTTHGVLIPEMTTEERDNITPLTDGLLVFNSDEYCFNYFRSTSSTWLSLCGTYPPAELIITTIQCSSKQLNGTYSVGEVLGSDNYITIEVTVTKPGTYNLIANAVDQAQASNGYYFSASGVFTDVGTYTVRLEGSGAPRKGYQAASGEHDSALIEANGESTGCIVDIPVTPADVDYAIDCSNPEVQGTYMVGMPLDPQEHRIVLTIDVTNPGNWQINTNKVNGYSFSGSGVFTATGSQQVTLIANGTPTAYTGTGGDSFQINTNATTSSAACYVPVVIEPVKYTMDGSSATVNGYYQVGQALDGSQEIILPIDVLSPGKTTITAGPINGLTFTSGEVNLTTLGATKITLKASGTPTAPAGSVKYTANGTGAVAATDVYVQIEAQPVSYTVDCSTTKANGTYTVGTAVTSNEYITLNVTVTSTGSYDIKSNTVNGVSFSGSGTFPTTGVNTIKLEASGTPAEGGSFEFSINVAGKTCTQTITMGYRPMNILYYGTGIYGGINAVPVMNFLKNATNFGPNGAVPINGQLNITGIEKPGTYIPAATIQADIDRTNADIVIMGYYGWYDAPAAQVLEDFIKNKGGYVIDYNQWDISTRAIFDRLGIGYTSATIINTGDMQTIINSSNPMTEGPFTTGTGNFNKDIKGGNWWNDVGDAVTISGLSGDVTAVTHPRTNTSQATVVIHNSLGFAWFGDGGWLAGNYVASGDLYPFGSTAAGLVVDKMYTGSPRGVTYNSRIFGNTIAHAIKYVQANKK